MQPGSTVATAISKEETGKKYCGILTIREKNFKLRKIELKTTRQVLKQWNEMSFDLSFLGHFGGLRIGRQYFSC